MTDEDAVQAASGRSPPLIPLKWRAELRDRVVKRGIQFVCGTPDYVPAGAASDIPLLRAGAKFAWLQGLRCVGRREFVTKSGIGYPFVCHIGDLSEYPYYHPHAYAKELALCFGWLATVERPIVYDLGANVGFISTHLAQMLAAKSPRIFAFEPVPETYAKLAISIAQLKLNNVVQSISSAIRDDAEPVHLVWSRGNSLVSHVRPAEADTSCGNTEIVSAPATTLDLHSANTNSSPDLIKMDIEGSEIAALRGARSLLAGEKRPAILFEYNPVTIKAQGTSPRCFAELLSAYDFHYVDDLENQLLPFGSPIADLNRIGWICNVFAVPKGAQAARWKACLATAQDWLKTHAARAA